MSLLRISGSYPYIERPSPPSIQWRLQESYSPGLWSLQRDLDFSEFSNVNFQRRKVGWRGEVVDNKEAMSGSHQNYLHIHSGLFLETPLRS